jgi:hypothetical protein
MLSFQHPSITMASLTRAFPSSADDDFHFHFHASNGALPAFIRLQRQISYFGDKDGLNGLMKHVGDEEANCEILGML